VEEEKERFLQVRKDGRENQFEVLTAVILMYNPGYNTSILKIAGWYVSTVLHIVTFQQIVVLGRKHTKQF